MSGPSSTSGLRVVTQSLPGARSASVVLLVPVGSRHEDEAHAGLSHLLEHLVFKGTRGHPEAGSLSQLVEGIGGSVNASTDRELTVYSSKVPAEHLDVALAAVSELALHPLLRRRDLSPRSRSSSTRSGCTSTRRPTTSSRSSTSSSTPGTRSAARSPGRSDRCAARRTMPSSTIGAARTSRRASCWPSPARSTTTTSCGPAPTGGPTGRTSTVAAGPAPRTPSSAPTPAPAGSLRVSHRRLSQGNLCLGMPGVARDDPDRWALDLLGAVLGDGMGSRLFLDLRERRSLVYDVSTFSASYADAGTFGVHAGFDPDDAGVVVGAILDQLDRICSEPVAPSELDRARAYTRGRLELRMEDSGAVAGWIGTGEALLPRILTVEEVIERFEAVTADDLLRVARRYLDPAAARLAVLGPFRSRSRFERALRR